MASPIHRTPCRRSLYIDKAKTRGTKWKKKERKERKRKRKTRRLLLVLITNLILRVPTTFITRQNISKTDSSFLLLIVFCFYRRPTTDNSLEENNPKVQSACKRIFPHHDYKSSSRSSSGSPPPLHSKARRYQSQFRNFLVETRIISVTPIYLSRPPLFASQ